MEKHIVTIITMAVNLPDFPLEESKKPIHKIEEVYLPPSLTNTPFVLAEMILKEFAGKKGFFTSVRHEPTPDNHLISMATDGKGNVALYTVY